jgi:KipI family sensor histidine kinase inhibitor
MAVPAGRLLPYGDRAVLIELYAAEEVIALRDGLSRSGFAGIVAVVPAARTVLVEFDPDILSREALAELVQTSVAAPAPSVITTSDLVTLPVHYDGADLADVADRVGESVEAVIARHTEPDYLVQFCGFSPGFGYLTGLDPRLHLPRLDSPRSAVPAGSVALAGEFTGVYPRSSPGGWRLLGHTHATVFDPGRPQPATLTPGTRVRFVLA